MNNVRLGRAFTDIRYVMDGHVGYLSYEDTITDPNIEQDPFFRRLVTQHGAIA